MANRNSHSADLDGNGEVDISNWSVSELISSLKSVFCAKDFARVEEVLAAREEINKREIHILNEEKDLFSDKFEAERLEKLKFETELKKIKKECEESRDEIAKLRKEIMVLREREKSSEERYKKLMEKVKRNGEKEKEMIDLKVELESEIERLKERENSLRGSEKNLKERCKKLEQEVKDKEKDIVDMDKKNIELEGEKDKATSDKEILMKNFEELDKRLLSLESDYQLLMNQEGMNEKGVEGENANSQDMGVKCDETVKVEKVFAPSCDSPVKSNENPQNAGSGRHPSQNTIEISDSDDDCTPAETPCEKGTTSLQSKQIDAENGGETLKRKFSLVINLNESENGDGDDDNHLLSKMKICEEPMSRNECLLSHCSTTTISSEGVEVNEGFPTTVEDFVVSRECEKQKESEQKSQNVINGFPLDGLPSMEERLCSSDSDSDDDNDDIFFNHSQLAPEAQRENQK